MTSLPKPVPAAVPFSETALSSSSEPISPSPKASKASFAEQMERMLAHTARSKPPGAAAPRQSGTCNQTDGTGEVKGRASRPHPLRTAVQSEGGENDEELPCVPKGKTPAESAAVDSPGALVLVPEATPSVPAPEASPPPPELVGSVGQAALSGVVVGVPGPIGRFAVPLGSAIVVDANSAAPPGDSARTANQRSQSKPQQGNPTATSAAGRPGDDGETSEALGPAPLPPANATDTPLLRDGRQNDKATGQNFRGISAAKVEPAMARSDKDSQSPQRDGKPESVPAWSLAPSAVSNLAPARESVSPTGASETSLGRATSLPNPGVAESAAATWMQTPREAQLETAAPGSLTAPNANPNSHSRETLAQISQQVTQLKELNLDTMSVVIKPDAQTELSLQLTRHNGMVEIQAQVGQGDFSSLRAHWDELQKSLSAQGVRLGDLERPQGASWDSGSSRDRAFERHSPANPELPSQNRGRSDLLEDTPARGAKSRGIAARRWESWA